MENSSVREAINGLTAKSIPIPYEFWPVLLHRDACSVASDCISLFEEGKIDECDEQILRFAAMLCPFPESDSGKTDAFDPMKPTMKAILAHLLDARQSGLVTVELVVEDEKISREEIIDQRFEDLFGG